jgi:hypothetical protein
MALAAALCSCCSGGRADHGDQHSDGDGLGLVAGLVKVAGRCGMGVDGETRKRAGG